MQDFCSDAFGATKFVQEWREFQFARGMARPIEDRAMVSPQTGPREVLFEFTAIGNVVKVSAIDPASGIEVSVMGPVRASRADLQQLALAKLNTRLASHSRT